MPALQTITINDGETTPVAQAFVPRNVDANGVARYKKTSGVPIGDWKLSISLRESESKIKARVVLALPQVVTETINGVSNPKEVRTAFADVNFTFDRASSTQERKNLVTMMANLLNEANTARPVLVNLEGVY